MDYARLLLLCCALELHSALAVDLSQCRGPLGISTGAIPESDITARSSYYSNVASHGRGGVWCPKPQITTDTNEWIEIDLRQVHVITVITLQGRFTNYYYGAEYAEAYLLEYWRPALGGKWVRYKNAQGKELIKVYKNTDLVSKHALDSPIWAQKIRFSAYSSYMRTVCMRVEVYGCPWNDGILYYSMPQGNWGFYDAAYDGSWGHELRHGLGQLTDGRVGSDNVKLDLYDSSKGQGWVGWRNDTRDHKPLEIKFEFDHVRAFSAVHVFCNNQFTKDVKIFSDVSVLFSIGGKHYSSDPIVYNTIEDKIFEYSRNVTIKLHHRIGKFVKLSFGFAARWIMISEITFDSEIAHGNFAPESTPTAEVPRPHERGSMRETPQHRAEISLSTAKQENPTYMAVIIGVLTAVILLLAVAMFIIVSRYRQSKNFASPLGCKSALPPEPAYATVEKDPTLMGGYRVDDLDERNAGANMTTLPCKLNDRLLGEYREPFDEYRKPAHAAYYGYSTVYNIDNKDLQDSFEQSDATSIYTEPMPVHSRSSDQNSTFSKSFKGSAKAGLHSFFPPPPPTTSAPASSGSSNLYFTRELTSSLLTE